MNITELSLLSWVSVKTDYDEQTAQIVALTIMDGKRFAYVEIDGEWDFYSTDKLKPIELTDDIMREIGFVKDGTEWVFTEEKDITYKGYTETFVKEFRINRYEDGDGCVMYTFGKFGGMLNVDYVHQLQQLMRIDGFRKEIEL